MNYIQAEEYNLIILSFILEPVKIILDCQIINEDTLVGLELQNLTPFRFHFHKLWINNYIRQILTPHTSFDINLILNLTNTNVIIHLIHRFPYPCFPVL